MKKIFILLGFILSLINLKAQTQTSQEFQDKINEEYSDPEKSPLEKKDLKKFTALPFFQIDPNFIVQASFKRTEEAPIFEMKTTTDRLPQYQKYGEATFQIQGKEYLLNLYQSQSLKDNDEYKDYLFLPFTDATNGNETYGGGRFIDLKIPEGDQILIDFNKAYNPYCAYNHAYSCPIPPKENDLDVRITAGVKYDGH